VDKFKYLGVVFTSDGKRNKVIDTRIGKANEGWKYTNSSGRAGIFAKSSRCDTLRQSGQLWNS